MEEDLVQAY